MDESKLGEIGRNLFVSSLYASLSPDDPEQILRRCSINNQKYVDYDFPANLSSLIKNPDKSPKTKAWKKFAWRRASDFLSDLKVFQDGIYTDDIRQGALADNSFLCALSCLAETPQRIEKLFLTKEANEWGLYAVEMCVYGEWKTIIVDDFFPCGNENSGPCFSKCNGDELWVIILEKAWAKIYGSYERIERPTSSDALTSLTGAPCENFTSDNKDLWDKLLEGMRKEYIMCASAGDTKGSHRLLESMGLMGNSSYAILKVKEVMTSKGMVKLINLRNPWGVMEWTGDWSDESELWTPELKREVGMTQEEDGTFWMSFTDFCDYFSNITICRVNDRHILSSVNSQHPKGSFDIIEFEVPRKSDYILTINQKDRDAFSRYSGYEYSHCRAILAKKSGENYEYVWGMRTSKRPEKLFWKNWKFDRGTYVLYVEFDWSASISHYIVSVYGESQIDFEKREEAPEVLELILKSRALQNGECISYSSEGVPECKRYHEILPEGYGYFYYVNKSTRTSIREDCFFKSFKNLELQPPYEGAKYSIVVGPKEESLVLIKQVDLSKDTKFKHTRKAFSLIGSEALKESARISGELAKRKDPKTEEELDVFVYTYKHPEGIAFLYENKTSNKTLEEKVTFKIEGLEIVGRRGDSVTLRVGPGESEVVELKSVSSQWSIQTSIRYSIS